MILCYQLGYALEQANRVKKKSYLGFAWFSQEFDLKDKQTAQSEYVHASFLQDKNLNLNSYWIPATLIIRENKMQKKKWFPDKIFCIIDINAILQNNSPSSQVLITIFLQAEVAPLFQWI